MLSSEDQASRALKKLLADTRYEGTEETMRCENGTEFLAKVSRVCDQNKVRREFTTPETAELNG